jgi:N-ethylmaleimide reductase
MPSADTRHLLSPVRLGPYLLPNRVAMAPMTRRRAGPGDVPTPLAATYYAQRASAGLVIAEATLIAAEGASYPGSPGIYSDEQVPAWRAVTTAVHAAGGHVFLQLWHAGRLSDPSFLGGATPVAPSPIPAAGEVQPGKPFVTPRELGFAEIPYVVAQFGEGARRAVQAGFDGLEIHAAHGYLLDQFLRDGANHRLDGYGGSPERRARFLMEVVEVVCRAWEPSRVGVQLSPTSPLGGMNDSTPAETFCVVTELLDRFGLAYLHVFEPIAPGSSAARITPLIRARFQGALIANGGYARDTADAAIARNEADLISFGRPFIANPDLPERFAEGAPLANPDPNTFYGGGAHGYIDYPRHQK